MTVDAPRHRSSFHHMAPALMTADELLHSNIPDKRTELVRGVLVVREPAGYNHGRVIAQLTGRLWSHVERNGSGRAERRGSAPRLRLPALEPSVIRPTPPGDDLCPVIAAPSLAPSPQSALEQCSAFPRIVPLTRGSTS